MPKVDKLRRSSRHKPISTASTHSIASSGSRSSSWSAKDDETLITARATGGNWNQIAPKHFPSKSPNACRKRHERLMERQNAEQWDGVELEVLAQVYMDARRQMWAILAAQVGEKWQIVEQKCMEKGLKNLHQAYRSAQKKQGTYDSLHEDSGIGISDLDEESHDLASFPGASSQLQYTDSNMSETRRVPSIQSILCSSGASSGYEYTSQYVSMKKRQSIPGRDEGISSMSDDEENDDPQDLPEVLEEIPSHNQIWPPQFRAATRQYPTPSLTSMGLSILSHKDIIPKRIGEVANETVNNVPDPLALSAEGRVLSDEVRTLDLSQQDPSKPSSTDGCSATDVEPPQTPNSHMGNSSYSPELPQSDGSTTSDVSSETSGSVSIDGTDQLRAHKEQILNGLMLRFYEIFNSSGWSCRNNEGSSRTPDSLSFQANVVGEQGRTKPGRQKRKSDESRDDEDDEDEDDSSRKKQKKLAGASGIEGEERQKLACPYFKHNPRKYRSCKSCPGPGWDTIHRLKEHLYRRHALPPHCPRCYETFESELGLKDHQRSEIRCILQTQEPMEGLDISQKEKLKRRQNMFQAKSEEDKWRIVYLILFPDTPLDALPSPYYDYNVGPAMPDNGSPKPQALVQYEAFLSRELPRKVRKELETAIENLIGPIEETLKNQLENIIRNCHESLSRTYQQRASSSPSLQKPPEIQSIATELKGRSAKPFLEEIVSDVLAPYVVPTESSQDIWPGLEFLSHNNHVTSSDSGYYSHVHNPVTDSVDDTWCSSFSCDPSMPEVGNESFDQMGGMSAREALTTSAFDTPVRYVGKGKGKQKVDQTGSNAQWHYYEALG